MPNAVDLTGRYNTQLSPTDEKQFQSWVEKNGRRGDLADYDLRGAWQDGAQQAENGHFTDKYKKPNHPTFSDESIYSGKDGFVGGRWQQNGSQWSFIPSNTNLQFQTVGQLQNYFARVEPDSKLLLNQRMGAK